MTKDVASSSAFKSKLYYMYSLSRSHIITIYNQNNFEKQKDFRVKSNVKKIS